MLFIVSCGLSVSAQGVPKEFKNTAFSAGTWDDTSTTFSETGYFNWYDYLLPLLQSDSIVGAYTLYLDHAQLIFKNGTTVVGTYNTLGQLSAGGGISYTAYNPGGPLSYSTNYTCVVTPISTWQTYAYSLMLSGWTSCSITFNFNASIQGQSGGVTGGTGYWPGISPPHDTSFSWGPGVGQTHIIAGPYTISP